MNVQKEMISYKTNVQLQINLHLSMWSKKNLGGWCDICYILEEGKSNSRKLKKNSKLQVRIELITLRIVVKMF